MTSCRDLTPLPRNVEREALNSMGGYDYQIWTSIEHWLMLRDDEVLFLEGAEDIDRVQTAKTTTVQIRRTEKPISLNSKQARDALRNFWESRRSRPPRTRIPATIG